MPSGSNAHNSAIPSVKVVVLCFRSQEVAIRRMIARHASVDWANDDRIRIVAVHDRCRRFGPENIADLNRVASPQSAARVVRLNKIDLSHRFGKGGDLRVLNDVGSLSRLEKKLPQILAQCSVDWFSERSSQLSSWQHGSIDAAHLTAWLDQFEKIGVLWIGKQLLRNLDWWSPERLRREAGLTPQLLSGVDCICVNRHRVGKSGDYLANVVSKHIRPFAPRLPVTDFRESLDEPSIYSKVKRILFLEDGLFTGTEMTNYLSALAGVPLKTGRKPSTQPLSNPLILKEKDIHLHFPLATSLGVRRLKAFLSEQAWNNIKISDAVGHRVEVLTNEGYLALDNNSFYDATSGNCVANPHSYISPVAFNGDWKTAGQRERAMEFCRLVGDQLFRNYLIRKGWTWPEKKIEPCCFGMYGLGLTVAFSHSVPKASLPIYWMDGRVNYNGYTIEWMPLFQNSAF